MVRIPGMLFAPQKEKRQGSFGLFVEPVFIDLYVSLEMILVLQYHSINEA
jgi:hypothetical protein